MSKYVGRIFLLKLEIDGAYVTVGCQLQTGLTIDGQLIDVSDQASVWRQLLEGGVLSVTSTSRGHVSNAFSFDTLLTMAKNGTIGNFQLCYQDGSTLTRAFQVSAFDASGAYDGAEEYSVTLESATAGEGGAIDPYFANVVSLLHFDGADASTGITDQISRIWTAFGNAQLDTAQSKFGTASLLLDGTGDYLTAPDHDGFAFGSGDFTIECFVRVASLAAARPICTQRDAAQTDIGFFLWCFHTDARFIFEWSPNGTLASKETITTPNGSAVLNTWHHVAVVRDATSIRIYADGVQGTSDSTPGALHNSSQLVRIGTNDAGLSTFFNGWIDDLRVTKGVARYTSNFTPPTRAFPNS